MLNESMINELNAKAVANYEDIFTRGLHLLDYIEGQSAEVQIEMFAWLMENIGRLDDDPENDEPVESQYSPEYILKVVLGMKELENVDELLDGIFNVDRTLSALKAAEAVWSKIQELECMDQRVAVFVKFLQDRDVIPWFPFPRVEVPERDEEELAGFLDEEKYFKKMVTVERIADAEQAIIKTAVQLTEIFDSEGDKFKKALLVARLFSHLSNRAEELYDEINTLRLEIKMLRFLRNPMQALQEEDEGNNCDECPIVGLCPYAENKNC